MEARFGAAEPVVDHVNRCCPRSKNEAARDRKVTKVTCSNLGRTFGLAIFGLADTHLSRQPPIFGRVLDPSAWVLDAVPPRAFAAIDRCC